MSEFQYFENRDGNCDLQHGMESGRSLSAESAQVVALIRIGEQLEFLNARMRSIEHLISNGAMSR